MSGRTGGRPNVKARGVLREDNAAARQVVESLSDMGDTTDSAVLLRDLVDIWGGPRSFAEEIYREFKAAKPGSNERQRYIDLIARIALTNTTHEIGKRLNPQDLSDADLERVVKKYLQKMNSESSSTEGRVNGSHSGPRKV